MTARRMFEMNDHGDAWQEPELFDQAEPERDDVVAERAAEIMAAASLLRHVGGLF